jgi:hypothetical protein
MTPADQIETIARARADLRTAQVAVADVAAQLRDAKATLKLAQQRLLTVIDDRDQPSLPFEEPAPVVGKRTWRDHTLAEAGLYEDWPEGVAAEIAGHGVGTCGELADRLLAGGTFGLPLLVLETVYGAVELMSSDDPAPIDFDRHFGPLAEPVPQPSAEPAQPRVIDVLNLPKPKRVRKPRTK